LFVAGNGNCAMCGKELEKGWHSDHIYPYSKGGETQLSNAQALCPECNLKKGDKFMEWPKNIVLREWQQDMFQKWINENKQDYLMVAYPASGKTIAALRIAHHLLSENIIDKLVIVVPSTNLRTQWKDDANIVGIQINHTWQANDGFADPLINGIAITYQAIAERMTANVLNLLCEKKNILVIFDEIHHCAVNKSWGDGIKAAFKNASYRLLLSGTPWRTENDEIPFVRYENNKCIADYNYTYPKGLSDGILRELSFWAYNGDVKWISDGEFKEVDFYDELAEQEARDRLNTAITTDGIPDELIKEAWEKLKEYREKENDPDAAMLIITKDFSKGHLNFIAKKVKKITGVIPVEITSDDDQAHKKLNEFRQSSDKIIIAVRMVSEGIDIKRLRVLVYLTNIATELFFRQACGRIIRRRNADDIIATVYLPADPLLMGIASLIKLERDHFLKKYYEQLFADKGQINTEPRVIVMLPTDNARLDRVIHDEQNISPEDINEARPYSEKYSIPIEKMGLILREIINDKGLQNNTHLPVIRQSIQDEKIILLKNIDEIEKKLALRDMGNPYDKEIYQKTIKTIHIRVNQAMSILNGSRHAATMDQIKKGWNYLLEEQNRRGK